MRVPLDPKAGEETIFDALIAAREKYGDKEILEDQDRKPLTYTGLIRAAFVLGRKVAAMTGAAERVGILLPSDALGEPVATNTIEFEWGGCPIIQHQTFFAVGVDVVPSDGISFGLEYGIENFDSLQRTRTAYFEGARFADVFASLERAPSSLEARIAALPGVETVATRVVAPTSQSFARRYDATAATA